MTKDEYANYEQNVAAFFTNEGINGLTTDDEESYFSWAPCECCGSTLGGDRYRASGFNPKDREVYKYEICTDCMYYAEYGQLDDMTMLGLEE